MMQELSEHAAYAFLFIASSIYCFYKAGRERGVFECILIFDTAKWWLGLKFSRAAFEQSKDANYDGKVSYWERTFPADGGHRTKLYEVIHIAIGIMLSLYGYVYLILSLSQSNTDSTYWIAWLSPILIAPAYFIIFSAGFLHSFKLYRNPPPEIHSDYQEPTQFIH
jgi:hypothetical protein